MREIKFRGIDKHNNWHYGYLWETPSKTNSYMIREPIESTHSADFEVIRDSIGQFIGLKDNIGKEIYEGDILKVIYCKSFGNNNVYYEKYVCVEINLNCFGYKVEYKILKEVKRKTDKQLLKDFDLYSEFLIIGNKFENTELLK